MLNRVMNLQPSKKDIRDWHYDNIIRGVSKLPDKYSIEQYCGDIRDQGKNGLCHAFAGSQMKNIQERIETGHKWNFSPLFLAKYTKLIDGITNTEGSTALDVMKSLHKFGTIQEEFYPYEKYKQGSLKFPDVENEDRIPHYKISNYARCNDLNDLKLAISNNKPVLIGFFCGSNLFELDNNAGKFCDLPFGTSLYGHAITAVGYDDTIEHNGYKGFVRCTNSWGTNWADNGFFWMPYEYFTFKSKDFGMKFVFDMFTSVDLKNDNLNGTVVELFIDKPIAYYNDDTIILDQSPIIDVTTSRALVPVRFISEILGYRVDWNDSEKKIIISNEKTKITLYIDKKYAYINGVKHELDKEPIISAKTNRALIPLRFVAENMGCAVLWDGKLNKITILKR